MIQKNESKVGIKNWVMSKKNLKIFWLILVTSIYDKITSITYLIINFC